MMAVRAVLYCCAGLYCATVRVTCVRFHRGHQKRCFLLPESAPESYTQILKYVLGQKSAEVIYFGESHILRWSLRLK